VDEMIEGKKNKPTLNTHPAPLPPSTAIPLLGQHKHWHKSMMVN